VRPLILGAILAYWRLVPPRRRRRCLFAKSCSRHVYDLARAEGGGAALRGLRERFRACRPGYRLLEARDGDGAALLRLADGRVVRLEEMSDALRDTLRAG
jgi:streptomycin 6-kinase